MKHNPKTYTTLTHLSKKESLSDLLRPSTNQPTITVDQQRVREPTGCVRTGVKGGPTKKGKRVVQG